MEDIEAIAEVAERLRELLDEIDVGGMDANDDMRARLEGGLTAIEILLDMIERRDMPDDDLADDHGDVPVVETVTLTHAEEAAFVEIAQRTRD